MTEDKWVKRWVVTSYSGNGEYIIAQDKEGNWACSCMAWTRHMPRRDCKHILEVKGGGGKTITEAVVDRILGR